MEMSLRAVGRIVIQRRESGVLVDEIVTHNRVVASGLAWMTDKLAYDGSVKFSSMQLGTSSQPVDASDQRLVSAIGSTAASSDSLGGVLLAKATFPEGIATGTITELGLFLNNGVMVARAVIPGQTKSSTTSFDVSWSITFQAA